MANLESHIRTLLKEQQQRRDQLRTYRTPKLATGNVLLYAELGVAVSELTSIIDGLQMALAQSAADRMSA